MCVLLLGAGGMLGHDLIATAPADLTVVTGPTQPRLDVTSYPDVDRTLDRIEPRYVVNAAGYTFVDRAESEPARANAVNGDAVAHLAAACAQRGIALVHFSTDYVFSGDARTPYAEDARPSPISAYGRSKLLGEQGIESSGARALIVRSQWLYGLHGRSFVATMLERARNRRATRVVDDQTGRPTYTKDLATWTWALVRKGETGMVHAANGDTATWFDLARRIFERVGAADCVSPCSTAEYPTDAKRPPYSVLHLGRITELLGQPPNWRDALDRFLVEAGR